MHIKSRGKVNPKNQNDTELQAIQEENRRRSLRTEPAGREPKRRAIKATPVPQQRPNGSGNTSRSMSVLLTRNSESGPPSTTRRISRNSTTINDDDLIISEESASVVASSSSTSSTATADIPSPIPLSSASASASSTSGNSVSDSSDITSSSGATRSSSTSSAVGSNAGSDGSTEMPQLNLCNEDSDTEHYDPRPFRRVFLEIIKLPPEREVLTIRRASTLTPTSRNLKPTTKSNRVCRFCKSLGQCQQMH